MTRHLPLLASLRSRECRTRYPCHYSRAFASYGISTQPPTACLTVSLPRGRRHWGSTFRTIDPVSNLGEPSTPVVRQFRAGSYKTCNLTTCANTRKHNFDLKVQSRSVTLTTLTDFRLISPYCSTLALNPVGLGKRSPPHGFDPIRYIVRWASHPVISATAACHPKVLAGTCQVWTGR